MRNSAPFRFLLAAFAILATSTPAVRAADTAVSRPNPSAANSIVIGFVGGFVSHNDPHHSPVQLAQRIRRTVPASTYVRVFENRRRKQAYDIIVALLDTNRDGILSADEKNAARIVLFGHSWGAAAAVLLARELRQQAIPVLLTIQVDSIAKLWQDDSIVPDNVAEAINFYQTKGVLRGRRQIVAADASRTEILGNYRLDYKQKQLQCPEYTWLYRHLAHGHMESECDPHLWTQVEILVKQRLQPSANDVLVSNSAEQPR